MSNTYISTTVQQALEVNRLLSNRAIPTSPAGASTLNVPTSPLLRTRYMYRKKKSKSSRLQCSPIDPTHLPGLHTPYASQYVLTAHIPTLLNLLFLFFFLPEIQTWPLAPHTDEYSLGCHLVPSSRPPPLQCSPSSTFKAIEIKCSLETHRHDRLRRRRAGCSSPLDWCVCALNTTVHHDDQGRWHYYFHSLKQAWAYTWLHICP